MNHESTSHPENKGETLSISRVTPETFYVLSARHRRLLYFVAYRVLCNHKDAEDAVESCLLSASYSVPRFEYEGSFRGWLVRVLIGEALAILHKNRTESTRSITYSGLAQLVTT
jgi:DNA-directed RNA polymerase specialized sigma24 family protein